ncbi:MAG: hypothetical protein GEU96_09950 [Propionibacteriales bacterium]|nr:hypothetical protein [Propionibacteriales bacterium]
MNEQDLATQADALPERFADRLEASDLADVRSLADGGEWSEEIDVLLACLQEAGQRVTSAERHELAALLDYMQMPHDRLDAIKVAG